MMVKMLAWHSVPGFNSPTSQEIVESLSAGANLWTDKIAKQISKQVPIPSAKELGLLLATGQVSHLKMRLKGVPSGSETVLDGVIPFAWSKIGSHKSQKKVAEDATWVLSRLSVSRLGELLETAKEWKNDDAAHVIDESDLDRALWLRVIENAWLMKSTPKTSSVQRPQRL